MGVRRLTILLCFGAIAVSVFAAVAGAQGPAGLPAGTLSLRVVGGPTNARVTPHTDGELRGAIRFGTRLAPLERRRVDDPHCPVWYRVGTDAWVCSSAVEPSDRPPRGRREPRVVGNRVVPFRYARVLSGGADVFRSPEDAANGDPADHLPAGHVIATRGYSTPPGHPELVRTLGGTFVSPERLDFFRPPRFSGVELGQLDHPLEKLGWIRGFRQPVYSRPRGRIVRRAASLTQVQVERIEAGFARLASGEFVAEDAVAQIDPLAQVPEGVGEGERWIDVNLATQTLIAYEGVRPVFATAVSTGRPWRGRETPTGVFRFWVKLATATMDDFGNADSADDYSVQAVPWVQYYDGSKGLHAAFWHQNFGSRASHGCINLAPLDARRMFEFTSPALPPGWVSIRPSPSERATVIRVR